MADFSAYSLILFAHVVAGVGLLATGLFAPLTLHLIRAARTLGELRAWVAFEQRSTRWNPAAAFLLLATGVYLGSYGWWTQPWFFVALGAWVVNAALAAAIVKRTAGALAHAAQGPGEAPVPAGLNVMRWSRGWTAASASLLASDLAILYVMFDKPGLMASLLLAVLANVVGVGTALARHRAAARAASLADVAAIPA
jgi:hypothetical protein